MCLSRVFRALFIIFGPLYTTRPVGISVILHILTLVGVLLLTCPYGHYWISFHKQHSLFKDIYNGSLKMTVCSHYQRARKNVLKHSYTLSDSTNRPLVKLYFIIWCGIFVYNKLTNFRYIAVSFGGVHSILVSNQS